MRHYLLSAMTFFAVLAFSNIGITNAEARKRHLKPALENQHLEAPGRARYHGRDRRPPRYGRDEYHSRSSFWSRRSYRKNHRSRYGVFQPRAYRTERYDRGDRVERRQLGYNQDGQTHHSGKKYRNRTQFCRRNWEHHNGQDVVVRRCVWIHNSKLSRHRGH